MRTTAGQHGRRIGRWAAAACCALAATAFAQAPTDPPPVPAAPAQQDPPEFQGVELVPSLGAQVPLTAQVIDWTGKTVPLGTYFNQGKPVVLSLVYYNCPLICPLMLQRLQDRVNGVHFSIGTDFNVVVISFDPSNTTEMAAANREAYLGGYTKPRSPKVDAGWTFHTAPVNSARAIADAVGFKYKFIPETGQYSHPSVLTVLTPDGRVSGYVSGLDKGPEELRAALLQASAGKIAKTWGDFFIHRCYRYDPKTGQYSLQVFRIMQVGALTTAAAVGLLIVSLRAGDRARRRGRDAAMPVRGLAVAGGGGGHP